MSHYVVQVPMRWTDQDSYGHLNNARAITLLEEARIAFLWAAAGAEHVETFTGGLLVAALHADYRRQVNYRANSTLRVVMTIDEVRAASFRIAYELHDGPDEDSPVAVRAWTRMALFDFATERPRRLTTQEREFLARYVDEAVGGAAR